MERRSTRMLVVTRDSPLLYCLKSLLAPHPEIEVTAVTGDGDQIMKLAAELLPDIVIIDIVAPRFDVIKQIEVLASTTNVLLLGEQGTVNHVLQAFGAGVRGYLHRSMPIEQIVPAIKAVIGGKVVIEPSIAMSIAEHFSYLSPPAGNGWATGREKLTRRELQVLSLIAEGYRNKQIALELGLSVRTVKAHIANTLSKMGVHTRSQAVAAATRQKLV